MLSSMAAAMRLTASGGWAVCAQSGAARSAAKPRVVATKSREERKLVGSMAILSRHRAMTGIPNLDLRGFLHRMLLLASTQTNFLPECKGSCCQAIRVLVRVFGVGVAG